MQRFGVFCMLNLTILLKSSILNRKEFLQKSGLLAGASVIAPLTLGLIKPNSSVIGSNNKLRFATIGINGMGWTNTLSLLKIPDVELVALCDVDQNVVKRRIDSIKNNFNSIDAYSNYKYILDREDIDAIVIGTPDHWHALMMIHALEAGKHVYVEKPLGNSIVECNVMKSAHRNYVNRVVQVGQWQRSQQHFRNALDFIDSGQLGNIRTVKVWCYQGWMRPADVVPDSEPPKGVDFAEWLGPAPTRTFNASRFHFHFRWFWDYAGGLMTDWGVHLLDFAILGMKASHPKSIVGVGGKFAYPELAQETPDTLTTLYEFDNFNLVWDSAMGIDNGSYGLDHGIAFIGNNATLVLSRLGWKVVEERNSKNKVGKEIEYPLENGLDAHTQNFVKAIRNNTPNSVNCSPDQATDVAIIAQMGNISYKSGQKLNWDRKKKQFTDDSINQKYLTKKYHNGYNLPSY